jgi:hypothetical protein
MEPKLELTREFAHLAGEKRSMSWPTFSPGGFDVKGLSLSEEMFELGEDLFDRIEVGL